MGHRRGHCDGNQGASIPGPKLRRLLLVPWLGFRDRLAQNVGVLASSAGSATKSSPSTGRRQPSMSHSQDDTETHARRETKARTRPPSP